MGAPITEAAQPRSDGKSGEVRGRGEYFLPRSVAQLGSETDHTQLPDFLSLCPVLVLRIAGLPALVATQLRPTEYSNLVNVYFQDAEATATNALDLCAALEAYCPNLRDTKLIHALINAKRQLFNMRMPRAVDITAISHHLPAGLRERLERSVGDIARLAEHRIKILNLHSAAVEQSEKALDALAMGPCIQDVISLYAPTLYSKVLRLIEVSSAPISRKEARAIRGAVLNYILRGALKSSPQSLLGWTSVAMLTGANGADPRQLVDLGDGSINIQTRLRHAPIRHLFQAMLHNGSDLGQGALLKLNPTLTRDEQGWSWSKILYNEVPSDRVFGVNDAKVKVTNRPIIELLVDAFNPSGPGVPKRLGELVHDLQNKLSQSSRLSVNRSLGQCIAQELLVPAMDVGAQEDILLWGRKAAAMLHTDLAMEVSEILDQLDAALGALDHQPTNQRPRFYADIMQSFGQLAKVANSTTDVSLYEPLVHDDCRLKIPNISIDLNALAQPLKDLAAFVRILPIIEAVDGRPKPSAVLTSAFLKKYGRDGVCEDVKSFLRSIPRSDLIEAPPHIDIDDSEEMLRNQGADFISSLARLAQSESEIRLDPSELGDVFIRMPRCFRARSRSHCLHLQFFPPNPDGRCVVVNQIFPGNARMISRFLTGADLQAVSAIREYLTSGAQKVMPVAVPGVFGFNANLHTRLADAEFDLSPFEHDHPNVPRLTLDNLRLHFDPLTNRVVLTTGNGVRLSPQYFGLLVPQRLPHEHQLLDAVGDNSAGVVTLSRLVGEKMTPNRDGVICIPRISIGSSILGRAALVAPASAFPTPNIDDAKFFFELQTWRRKCGLPSEVYYQRLRDRNPAKVFSANGESKLSVFAKQPWKSAKPMYLDFGNPLCVRAFQQNLAKRSEPVLIAEALPTPGMAVAKVGGEAHILEIAVDLKCEGRI